jgi:tRNA A-37 threonylcarbamoyl transferase component Bud32/tetratricopeptide (TPR) repeat protein
MILLANRKFFADNHLADLGGNAMKTDDPLLRLSSQAWDQVRSAVRKFESAWQERSEGDEPKVKDFLDSDQPDTRLAMLAEMIHADVEFRLKRGEDVRLEPYLDEFPEIRANPGRLHDLLEGSFRLPGRIESTLAHDSFFKKHLDRHLDPSPASGLPIGVEAWQKSTIDARSQESRRDSDRRSGDSAHGDSSYPVVPGYEILDELGRGGMGIVYKARHEALNRIVALKMIGSRLSPDGVVRSRFRTEAEAAASIQSPFVVQVFEIGECSGHPFLAIEFCDGGNLGHALKTGPKPLSDIVRWTLQIAEGVAAAHRMRVVHRDLKPANILFTATGQLKVSDFGLAKKLDEPGLTQTGEVMGTPAFMAPEQANGDLAKMGPETDVYGIGAILYQMLAGTPPFTADSTAAILELVRNREPAPPSRVRPKIPRDLETICLKCLNKEPASRYRSGTELAEDLKRYEAGEPILGRRIGWIGRTVRAIGRRPALSASLALLAIAGVLSVFFGMAAVRNGRIADLTSSIESELRIAEPTAAHAQRVETLIADLEPLDPNKAADMHRLFHERVAERTKALLRDRLTPSQKERIEAGLALLATRDTKLHDETRSAYRQRISDWDLAFDLKAPFEDLPIAFDASRDGIEIDGDCLVRRESPGHELGFVVGSKVRFPSGSQVSAEFDKSWSQKAFAELAFSYAGANGYVFRFWVSDPAGPFAFPAPNSTSFQESMKKGRQTHLGIWRSYGNEYRPITLRRLSSDVLSAHCPADQPLQIQIARDGDRLSFQLNDMPPMVFHDLFPFAESGSEGFWMHWPAGLRLRRCKAYGRSQTAAPSLIEEGDRQFNRERFAPALDVYERLMVQAEEPVLKREAIYKAALCNMSLGRSADARKGFERLAGLLEKADGASTDPWTWLANTQLLQMSLRNSKDRAQADEILDRMALMKTDGSEDLSTRVPYIDVHEMANFYSQRGISLFARRTAEYVKTSERADAFADLFSADNFMQTQCKHLLTRAYRLAGRTEEAKSIVDNWLGDVRKHQSSDYEFGRVILEENGWLARESKNPVQLRTALAVQENWLYFANPMLRKDGNRTAYPLLAERARLQAALGDWEQAAKSLDDFLQHYETDKASAGVYSTYGEVCLLRGFLHERNGNAKAANETWTRGLWKNWHAAKEGTPFNIETAAGAGLLCQLILASLTDQPVDTNSEAGLDALFAAGDRSAGPQAGSSPARLLQMMNIRPQVLRQAWRTPRAREWAKRIALRDLTFAEYVRVPIYLLATEYVRDSIGAKEPPPELEKVIFDCVSKSYEAYQANKITERQSLALASAWQGIDLLGFGWSSASPDLDPALRGPIAYFLARKAVLANRTDSARRFLKTAGDDAAPDSPLRRLVQAELARISK